MRHKLALTSAALSAVALLAGCGSGAGTTDTSEQPATSSVNMHGAPEVQNPLDTEAFQQKPCSVLESDQINALDMQQWEVEQEMDAVGGPKCGWTYMGGPPDYTVSNTGVTFMAKGTGLKGVYQRKDAFEYFRELKPVEGFPAVAGASLAPQTSTPEEAGECDIHVGVTDDLAVTTQVSLGEGSPYAGDPCGRARDVATEVVKTLKAGA
ncbi:Protein of unknown function [Actinopolyspora saharensis]|uniref:DUF3558 domain-containing protein n=1 Tax=Actinopolyspora saharensis TaxID=995062 RepID=A0A1H1GVG3_9ACTN|nr:Protein of unknown function [Actinopolyspora saharensis]